MSARKVRCCPALNANLARSSGGISKRMELASLVSGTICATRSAWKCSAILPGRVGVGARQELHHREDVAQMLAVVAAPPAEDRPLVRGRLDLAVFKHLSDRRAIFVLESARVGGDAALDQPREQLVDLEEFGDEPPAPVEALGHSPGAFLGAVGKAHGPLRRQLAVIGHLLDRL